MERLGSGIAAVQSGSRTTFDNALRVDDLLRGRLAEISERLTQGLGRNIEPEGWVLPGIHRIAQPENASHHSRQQQSAAALFPSHHKLPHQLCSAVEPAPTRKNEFAGRFLTRRTKICCGNC